MKAEDLLGLGYEYCYELPSGFLGCHIWVWHSFQPVTYTPKCVPSLHRDLKANVCEIYHGMDKSCKCPENSDVMVSCIIRLDGSQGIYKGKHLPGQCPGIRYKPRAKSKQKLYK